MTRRKKKTPAEFVPGSPPDCLPNKLLPEFHDLIARFTVSGHEPDDVQKIILARYVMAADDVRTAESAAAAVPAVVETRSNGPQAHPAHKAVETRKRELRAWVRLLPKIAPAVATVPPRTSASTSASSASSTTSAVLQVSGNPLLSQPGITAERAEFLGALRERLKTATAPQKRELFEAVRARRAELANNPDTDGGSG
jgi:hypothetical protein